MNHVSSVASQTPLLGSQEISRCAQYLSSTRDNLLEALDGLSDPQWHFKPSADTWSIAEVVEHLVLIEERVGMRVGSMQHASHAAPDRVNAEVEEIILTQVPDRSSKVGAPPVVLPANRWPPGEAVERFRDGRTRTIELLVEAPHLRGYVAPHPIFGDWDGYQWLLAAAAHTARHTAQILEIKACSGFPHPDSISNAPLS